MPRPEVEVLEGSWNYGTSTFLRGMTDTARLKISAPFDSTEEAENERITRIVYGEGFAGWDPIKLSSRASVVPAILLSVMENMAQRKASGVFRTREHPDLGPYNPGRVPPPFYDEVLKTVKNKEVKAMDRIMAAMMVSVATGNYTWLDKDVAEYIQHLAKFAVEYLDARHVTFDKTWVLNYAKAIQGLIPSPEEVEEMENTKKEEFKTDAEMEGEPEDAEAGNAEDAKTDTDSTDAIEIEKDMPDKPAEPQKLWGAMQVVFPPLESTKKLAAMARATQHLRDSGKKVVRLSRALIDGKVFRSNKKKKMAGTILIDNSGSMGLTPQMVEEIILNSPGSKVAIYSGNGREGVLTIVADRGKVASVRQFAGLGGNEVDGPALEWLGRQEKPTVWVSDGQVVGIGGQTKQHHDDVAKIRKKYNIKWLDTKQYGRSSVIIDKTIEALLKGTFKDGGDTLVSNAGSIY